MQSVDRALTILEVLARSARPGSPRSPASWACTRARRSGWSATLEGHRLVEQAEDRGKYRLGVGVLRLAGATAARLDVVQEARPVCRQLAAATGETVNITVLSESSALYLDQVAGSSALQPHNWVGQHIPLHATSNGKVLLSGLDPSGSGPVAAHAAVVHATDRSPDRPALRAELDMVREQGYAVAVDELEVGLTAVAAPIRNAGGDVVASMSVSGPTFRLSSGSRRSSAASTESALEVSLPPRLGTPSGHDPRVVLDDGGRPQHIQVRRPVAV